MMAAVYLAGNLGTALAVAPAIAPEGVQAASVTLEELESLGDESADCVFAAVLHPVLVQRAARVLRTGGVLEIGLAAGTGAGAGLAASDLGDLARNHNFQVLVSEPGGAMLWRRRDAGWRTGLSEQAEAAKVVLGRVVSAIDGGPMVAQRGRFARFSLWVRGLPGDADLLDAAVLVDGIRAHATAISPETGGTGDWRQIEGRLPELDRSGLFRMELEWMGVRLGADGSGGGSGAMLRVVPAPPLVPHVVEAGHSASRKDGLTVVVEELGRPDEFTATLDGRPVWGLETLCTDSEAQRYEIHFQLPDDTAAGVHLIEMAVGRRKLAPLSVELG